MGGLGLTILDVLYGIIFQPQSTMRELAQTRPLRMGLLVFMGAYIISYLFQGASNHMSLSAFENTLFPLPFWWLGLAGLFMALLLWFLAAGLLSLLAEVIYGFGNGKALLTCLGFAVFPGVLGPACHYLAIIFSFESIGVILYLISAVWVIGLQVLAVKEALQLGTGQAILIYILPLAVIMVLSISLLVAGGLLLGSLPLP